MRRAYSLTEAGKCQSPFVRDVALRPAPVVRTQGIVLVCRRPGAVSSTDRDTVVRAYRRYAPVYDWVFGRMLEAGRVEMAKAVRAASPESLLEVGVGTGLALPHYPPAMPITGVDLSMDMLRRAQGVVRDRRLDSVTLLCCDAEKLPLHDSCVDCVTLPYVLSVTPNPPALMTELRRVCRPGGVILVLNHFKGAGVWQFGERLVAPLAARIGFRSDLAFDVLDNPGWEIEEVSGVNLFGLSKLVRLRNGVA